MDLLAKIISKTSMKLYPHYKSHKCPAIAKLQMEKGAAGITCANLGEAIDLCEAGIPVVIIANEVVQTEKLPKGEIHGEKGGLTQPERSRIAHQENSKGKRKRIYLLGWKVHCGL